VAAFGSRGPVASSFLGDGCQGCAGRGHRCGCGAGWQQPRMGTMAQSAGHAGLADKRMVMTAPGTGSTGRADDGRGWG
jgi:hypothetical protein